MTPKQVAAATRVGYEAIKKWLQRNEGVHVKLHAPGGWYRARADVALLRQVGLEPIQVHSIQAHLSPRRGSPPLLGGQRDRWDRGRLKESFLGRLVTIQAEGEAGLFVSVRASVEPFSVPEFAELAAYLEGLAGPGGAVRLESCDLHIDEKDHKMKMHGLQSLALGEFRESLMKVYNKQVLKATRLEACLHRIDLDMGEAAKILHQLTQQPVEWPWPVPAPMQNDPAFS